MLIIQSDNHCGTMTRRTSGVVQRSRGTRNCNWNCTVSQDGRRSAFRGNEKKSKIGDCIQSGSSLIKLLVDSVGSTSFFMEIAALILHVDE